MMESLNVSAVQIAPRGVGGRTKNVENILETLRKEAAGGSQLIVFPEVSITGFFRHEPGGLLAYWEKCAIDPNGPEIQKICDAVKELHVFTIVGFAEHCWATGKIFNSAALIGPSGVIGITRKMHLPGLEKLYFSPGRDVPVFDCELGRIGIVICYDSMFPEYIGALSRQGVDIIVFTSSIWAGGAKGGVGTEESKRKYWSVLPLVTAIQNQSFVVSCNGCGTEDMGALAGEWERLGLSQIVTPTGDVLQKAGEAEAEVISARLDRDVLVNARTSYRFIADRALP